MVLCTEASYDQIDVFLHGVCIIIIIFFFDTYV